MQYTPKFTYIIPFRYQNDRILNLRRVTDWISGFSGVEVIIVEQDSHSKISHLNLKANHIFIKNPGHFNKNWALNVGLKRANSEIIIFGDSDLIMNPEHLIKSLDELRNYDFVNPYKSVIDLTEGESSLGLPQVLGIDRVGRGEDDHQKVPMCGGITIFRRDSIYKIGGFPENFEGWGAEDDAQTIRVETFLNWKQMPYKCYHLYHHRGAPDMQQYQKNLKILSHFKSMSKDDLQKNINLSSQRFGRLNAYDK